MVDIMTDIDLATTFPPSRPPEEPKENGFFDIDVPFWFVEAQGLPLDNPEKCVDAWNQYNEDMAAKKSGADKMTNEGVIIKGQEIIEEMTAWQNRPVEVIKKSFSHDCDLAGTLQWDDDLTFYVRVDINIGNFSKDGVIKFNIKQVSHLVFQDEDTIRPDLMIVLK